MVFLLVLYPMTQHTLLILFLIVSAAGSTIIISKGDIFKPFRDWLDRLSKSNKRIVHDFSIPIDTSTTPNAFAVYIDGEHKATCVMGVLKDYFTVLPDWVSAKSERTGFEMRYYIETKSNHHIVISSFGFNVTANTYERNDSIKWIEFIHQMISCPMCCAVWSGFAWYFISAMYGWINFNPFLCLSFGATTSFVAYLYYKLYTLMEKASNYFENKK